MKFTFGIITSPESQEYLQQIVDSISDQNISPDNFEILIVGGKDAYQDDNMTVIPFDHTTKRMWITRQKNIITERAKYENVVYFHDYVILNPGWYQGFLKYGNDFQACMTPIDNIDGSRFRDWTLCPAFCEPIFGHWDGNRSTNGYLLPYDDERWTTYMYFSGAYWVAKKDLMQKFPLDETRGWGDSEDIEWSQRVAKEYKFQFNPYSSVKLLKPKDPVFSLITLERLKMLEDYAKGKKI